MLTTEDSFVEKGGSGQKKTREGGGKTSKQTDGRDLGVRSVSSPGRRGRSSKRRKMRPEHTRRHNNRGINEKIIIINVMIIINVLCTALFFRWWFMKGGPVDARDSGN